MALQKHNPFQTRNRIFQARHKLKQPTGSNYRRHFRGGDYRYYYSGYVSTTSRLGWILRLVGSFTAALGTSLIFYYKWHWILLFLKGPTVDKPYQGNIHDLTSSLTDTTYRSPEAPRPPRKAVFTRLTQEQRNGLAVSKQSFQQLKINNQLIPCRLDDGDCATTPSSSIVNLFRSTHKKSRVLLHNPLPEDRFWCGKRILGSGGTVEIDNFPDDCQKPNALPYVNLHRPPVFSQEGIPAGNGPPIELCWNSDEFFFTNDVAPEIISCSIPCRSSGNFNILNTINVPNTPWEVILTMEGEQYYSEAHVHEAAYRDGRFYATTSFQSEIPVPYFSWAEYNIQHPPVDFAKAIKAASFLANNCDSQNHREVLVKNLTMSSAGLRVDSLSECLHNAEPPPGVVMSNKTDILKEYLFHLAFENQREDDYITEKLWGALAAGTLPVYYGAPNVKEHVPPKSVIIVDDYETVEDLAKHLVTLSNHKHLYESYHAWRYQPLDETFAEKYGFTRTHSTCRLCKWAYATRHGLAWNHTQQEVMEPFVRRKTCRNKVGLVSHPFKEYWIPENGNASVHISSVENIKTCKLTESNRVIDIDHGTVSRKVFDHDGVTDLLIDVHKMGSNYILRLQTPIVATEYVVVNDSVRWLQDSQSRLTILCSENNIVPTVIGQGIVQLSVSASIRMRIIVENVDHFHKGAKKLASYFGDLMTRDFYAPVEAYKVTS